MERDRGREGRGARNYREERTNRVRENKISMFKYPKITIKQHNNKECGGVLSFWFKCKSIEQ